MSADQQGARGRRPVGDLARTEQPRKTSLSTSTKHHTPSTFKDLTYCTLIYLFNVILNVTKPSIAVRVRVSRPAFSYGHAFSTVIIMMAKK